MIYCGPFRVRMLHIDPCLIRQEHPAFPKCHSCPQGIIIKEAIYWIEGKTITPIRIRPVTHSGGRRKSNSDVFTPRIGRPVKPQPLIAKNPRFKKCSACKQFHFVKDFPLRGEGRGATYLECSSKNRMKGR
jgi:hypothetical protein